MSKCSSCGCNDADIDWGLCYDCWVIEDNRLKGALSSVAAMNYESMGMYEAAQHCRNSANKTADIGKIKEHLNLHPEKIPEILQLLNL